MHTLNYSNYILFIYWINNIIDNKLNNEILLLIFDHKYYHKEIEQFQENLKLDYEKYNYKIVDIKEIDSFNNLKKYHDKNIIVVGYLPININKMLKFKGKILFSFYSNILKSNSIFQEKHKYLKKEDIKKVIKKLDNETDIKDINYENYLEYINPIEIINSKNAPRIIFNKYMLILDPLQLKALQSNNYYAISEWNNKIESDLNYLFFEKILTSRLAIFIYKASTFNFNDSNTKIGLYYKKKLGIKSKLINKEKEKLKVYIL